MRHALVGGFGLFAGWLAGWLAGVQSGSAVVAFLRVIRTRQLAQLNLESIGVGVAQHRPDGPSDDYSSESLSVQIVRRRGQARIMYGLALLRN